MAGGFVNRHATPRLAPHGEDGIQNVDKNLGGSPGSLRSGGADVTNSVDHSAAGSLLGYLYQVEVALIELIKQSRGRGEPRLSLSIERFDDVSFDVQGDPHEILQTKHVSSKSMSDASTDLWRTIKVWLDLSEGAVEIDQVVFSLITTSNAPESSAAAYLRANPQERDVDKAERILERVAVDFGNKDHATYYEAYLRMDRAQRKRLLERVLILDGAQPILNIEDELRELLWHATDSAHHDKLLTGLLGWWYRRVVLHLTDTEDSGILADELDLAIGDLRERLLTDDLHLEVNPEIEEMELEGLTEEDRVFVQQLKLLSLDSPALADALLNYKRAFQQRSEWVRKHLVSPGELERYERQLIEEWKFFFALIENMGGSEEDLQEAGLKLYKDVQTLTIFIRERARYPWIMRGSYHMLADELRVGWHPQFVQRLRDLLPAEPQ